MFRPSSAFETLFGIGVMLRICAALATLVAGYHVANRYETTFAPVIPVFSVNRIATSDGATHISGEMVKKRNCELLYADVVVGDANDPSRPRERLIAHFPGQGDGARSFDRGPQAWGPIVVEPPSTGSGPHVFMIAANRCHPLWVSLETLFVLRRDALFPPDASDIL